mgnify:CR=1 FL=1
MKSIEKVFVLLVALLMVGGMLVAAGSSEESPAGTEAAPAPASLDSFSMDNMPELSDFTAVLETQADPSKTGSLVIYSTCSSHENEGVLEMFKAKYPNISMEIIGGGTGELTSRIDSEAANPQGDVMWGGLNQQSYGAWADLFTKYLPVGYENLYDFFQTDQNIIWMHVDSPAVLVNNALIEELGVEINTYDDLLNEKLKGWIIAADPTTSSSSRMWFTTALLYHGGIENDEAWNYLEALMENFDGFIASSSSHPFTFTTAGEYAVGLTYMAASIRMLMDGADVSYVLFDPTMIQGFGMGMIKNAPNEENAKLFMDFILSDEWQSYYSVIGMGGTTTTATNFNRHLEAINNVSALEINWSELDSQTEIFKEMWRDTWESYK